MMFRELVVMLRWDLRELVVMLRELQLQDLVRLLHLVHVASFAVCATAALLLHPSCDRSSRTQRCAAWSAADYDLNCLLTVLHMKKLPAIKSMV